MSKKFSTLQAGKTYFPESIHVSEVKQETEDGIVKGYALLVDAEVKGGMPETFAVIMTRNDLMQLSEGIARRIFQDECEQRGIDFDKVEADILKKARKIVK